jgi:crossover junction endonuclease EME1
MLSKSHLTFAPADGKRKAASTSDALELMLQEIQGITPSAASGIASEYTTFADLMRAFEKSEQRGGAARAEAMLEECQVKSLRNGTASGRKLNKVSTSCALRGGTYLEGGAHLSSLSIELR